MVVMAILDHFLMIFYRNTNSIENFKWISIFWIHLNYISEYISNWQFTNQRFKKKIEKKLSCSIHFCKNLWSILQNSKQIQI